MRKYIESLENLIMDDLLPMYIVGCRSVGVDPQVNIILKKLLQLKALRNPLPYLLEKHD